MKKTVRKTFALCLVLLLLIMTSSYAIANPLAGTQWFQKSNKYACTVYEFTNELVTYYFSPCTGDYSTIGSETYKITRANNGMYYVETFTNNGRDISSSYFIGFIKNKTKLLKCPADNWESCKYNNEVWHKR